MQETNWDVIIDRESSIKKLRPKPCTLQSLRNLMTYGDITLDWLMDRGWGMLIDYVFLMMGLLYLLAIDF